MLAMSGPYALFNIADRYFDLAPNHEYDPEPTLSPPTASNSPSPEATGPASSGLIAGAVIGALAGCALLFGIAYLPYQTYRAKLRRAQELASLKDQKVEGKTA